MMSFSPQSAIYKFNVLNDAEDFLEDFWLSLCVREREKVI